MASGLLKLTIRAMEANILFRLPLTNSIIYLFNLPMEPMTCRCAVGTCGQDCAEAARFSAAMTSFTHLEEKIEVRWSRRMRK